MSVVDPVIEFVRRKASVFLGFGGMRGSVSSFDRGCDSR
jgi:hypothetical protein